MKKLFPLILALIGLGGGVGAGIALRPAPTEMSMENPCGDMEKHQTVAMDAKDEEEEPGDTMFVKLNNQFVVPVMEANRVSALVVMSLTLEVENGQSESVYAIEPKLRDVFLQVLFDHANTGGFSGSFTNSAQMSNMRLGLKESAKKLLSSIVKDVLIVDLVRQDA